jgi:hypothetical protein
VDATWLAKNGYSTALRRKYLKSGWLEQPARQVYRRPGRHQGPLRWQQVVISLQNLLQKPLVVGGRTALETQGFAHYLSQKISEVHLYGPKAPPSWLNKLAPSEFRFVYHNDRTLFANDPVTVGLSSLTWNLDNERQHSNDPWHASFVIKPWGQSDWPLTISTPERAILELLNELPARESFHQVDMLMGSLTNLSPRRLQKLLVDCKSVKVKRLFFFFADRQRHAWLKKLDKEKIDLGNGKRMLVKGGKLDPMYLITVPEDLNGIQ